MRLALPCAALLCFAVEPQTAHACQPAPCTAARVAPPAGAAVPSTVPALAFTATRSFRDPMPPADPPNGVALFLDGGGLVPLTVVVEDQARSEYLLIPKSPLAVGGRYRWRWAETCRRADPEPVESLFAVGAAAPLPAAAGTLAVAAEQVERIHVLTSAGSCTAEITAATARLKLVPAPALTPFLATTRVVAVVDGKEWARSEYGALPPDGSAMFRPFRQIHQIYSRCPWGAPTSEDDGVAPGRHRVEWRLHVAGAKSDPPPLTVDVNLACAPAADGGSDGGWAMDSGGPRDLAPAPDLASGGDGSEPPLPPRGCACGVGGATAPPWPAMALLLLLGIRCRRERD